MKQKCKGSCFWNCTSKSQHYFRRLKGQNGQRLNWMKNPKVFANEPCGQFCWSEPSIGCSHWFFISLKFDAPCVFSPVLTFVHSNLCPDTDGSICQQERETQNRGMRIWMCCANSLATINKNIIIHFFLGCVSSCCWISSSLSNNWLNKQISFSDNNICKKIALHCFWRYYLGFVSYLTYQ